MAKRLIFNGKVLIVHCYICLCELQRVDCCVSQTGLNILHALRQRAMRISYIRKDLIYILRKYLLNMMVWQYLASKRRTLIPKRDIKRYTSDVTCLLSSQRLLNIGALHCTFPVLASEMKCGDGQMEQVFNNSFISWWCLLLLQKCRLFILKFPSLFSKPRHR